MAKDSDLIQADRGRDAINIRLVSKDNFQGWAKNLSRGQRAALEAQKFDGGGYQVGIVPDGDGWFAVGGVTYPAALSSWCLAKLAEALPAGTYRLAEGEPGPALFGWQIAQYRFTRYRDDKDAAGPRVLLTKDAKAIEPAIAEARAAAKVMDLVNTPAEDMGPAALEAEAEALAKAHKAELSVTRGEALEREYPMVHAVGRAASRDHAPRLIHLTWGDPAHPVLAIVGKGVCFDSGGLDVKPASGMLLMKKDMGGAAHALALAGLVMGAGLKVRLHLIVPAVENAISGNSFRPGDVLRSRKGLSVEIGNTDAEGRLILGDALARASEESPELIIDFATLTGAARVALGPDLPALFANDDALAEDLLGAGTRISDPVWRMPLWKPYDELFASDVADFANMSDAPFAGAVTAALFLQKFVPDGIPWAHLDTFAWRPAAKPGRPKGGDALGLRAAWAVLCRRYGR
jgi:leucyl aminopeptidase